MTTKGLGALIVTALPNITYLTGFTGSSAIVVVTGDRVYFVTDSRYATAVEALPVREGLDIVIVEGSYDATLVGLLARLPPPFGFESQHLTVARYNWMLASLAKEASGAELVPVAGMIEQERVVKDAAEIATLREAARRISVVAREVVGDVRRGMTESELALVIESRIRRAGFSRPAFETIVASGPNSALPHARPGERRLTEGDLVVLDFGGVYDSYCSDVTRTVAIGPASPRVREVYAAVLEAHSRAVAACAPGASRFAIDAAARDTLADRGLGVAFGHGTGHGLGIEVHEDPRIVRRRGDIDTDGEEVKPGMVFTIEPGAYLPGWGGVRIEDDVLITDNGVDVLTDAPRDLLEL